MTLYRVGSWLALLMLATGLLSISHLARADEFHQSVTVPMTVEHDTNLAMAANKQGVTRAILAPRYNLAATYGVDEYKLGFGLNVERSSDQIVSADREDPDLSVGWQRQTETGGFGLVARYNQVSTRQDELEQTGRLLAREGTTTNQSLGGNWSMALSERNTLAANADVKDVSHDSGALTDYTDTSAGLTFSHAWSERIAPFLRLTAGHYEPALTRIPSSDNTTLMGGVKWQVSENLEWSGQAGAAHVSRGNLSDTGWQGSFALRYLGPRYDASLDIGRSITASGEGGYVESDLIKGTLGYAIDERTRSGLDVSWQDNKGISPNTLQQFGAWASHELSPFWNARLYYRHKQRQQNSRLLNNSTDATGDVLGLTFVYTHPDF